MANRRFEMYEVRQIIQRLRLGESDRGIARAQRVGRATVAHKRLTADEQNWLDGLSLMPDDALIATHYKASSKGANTGAIKNPQNQSTVEPFREEVLAWHQQGIGSAACVRRWYASTATAAACMPCTGSSSAKPRQRRQRR